MLMKTIKSLFLFHLLLITGYCQQTILFADSIRNANHIPELSYAVINANQILEMAALGKHSVNLNDPATINDRFHIGSNTKALTAFMIFTNSFNDDTVNGVSFLMRKLKSEYNFH